MVHPHEARGVAEGLIRALRDGLQKSKALRQGLVGTYRLARLDADFVGVRLEGGDPGRAYIDALRDTFEPAARPDAALVLLRDDDAELPEVINPYVATKTWLLSQGIPSQSIRMSKATASPSNLQYILQDLSLALYAKLGGSPWTVLPSTPVAQEVVVGIAYSETQERFARRRRFMGIATVFSSDGTYILGASSPQCDYDDYPEVLADTVRRTIRRLATDQRWGKGDLVRLVVHMGKTLTRDDISSVSTAASAELVEGVRFETSFLQIRQAHPFVLFRPGAPGRRRWVDTLDGSFGQVQVGEAVPDRGTVLVLGRSRRLLSVTGPEQLKQEGGLPPSPLLVELHSDSTYKELGSLVRQVFQFTGLSWKSVRPISEPVTLLYPKLIARLVSRLSSHPDWSDDLMATYLLRSRWFL